MMNVNVRKSVFGLASSRIQASRIVNHLANAGFSRDDISVMQPEHGGEDDFENNRPGAIYGNGNAELSMGFPQGWFKKTRACSRARFNRFTAGGPISGGLCGATVASASREMIENNHEGAKCRLLICLRAGEWREAEAARKIFQVLGATNITLGGEKALRLLTQTFRQLEAGPELQPFS